MQRFGDMLADTVLARSGLDDQPIQLPRQRPGGRKRPRRSCFARNQLRKAILFHPRIKAKSDHIAWSARCRGNG